METNPNTQSQERPAYIENRLVLGYELNGEAILGTIQPPFKVQTTKRDSKITPKPTEGRFVTKGYYPVKDSGVEVLMTREYEAKDQHGAYERAMEDGLTVVAREPLLFETIIPNLANYRKIKIGKGGVTFSSSDCFLPKL